MNYRHLLVLSLAASTAAAQSVLSQNNEVVLAVGDPAPGIPGCTISATSNFDSPVLDQNGTMVFRARLAGAVTGADDRALFMGRSKDDLRLVLRAGSQAPGLPAGILVRSNSATAGSVGLGNPPRISPFGELLLLQVGLYDPVTPTNTPTTADTALLWGSPLGLLPLAREGDQVPFLAPGINWGPFAASIQNNHINASGQVLFFTNLVGATAADDGVIVSGTLGSLVPVLREGQTFPGGEVVAPVTGATQLSFVLQLNEAGMVLHEINFATTAPSTATTANNRALAVWTPTGTSFIAREGSQAPGLPAGVVFGTPTLAWTPGIGAASFTKSGKVAFQSQVDQGGTVVGVDDYALFYGTAATLAPIYRRGGLIPALANGERFGITGNTSVSCNDAGQVAFINNMTGPSVTTANDSIALLWDSGTFVELAREGEVLPASFLAPSTNGPWVVEQISNGTNTPLLNGRGDVWLPVSVNDGVGFKNVVLSYVRGIGRVLQFDFAETITVNGAPATCTGFSSNAGFNSSDGGQSHFNNQGDIVVRPSLSVGTACILRGHVGALQAKPAAFAAAAGGTQNFAIDCGPARALNIYALVGSVSGTRPGTPSPLGPQTIPLVFDGWTQLSIDLANGPVYTNSLSFLDGFGKGTASFNLPPALVGVPSQLHHAVVTLDFNLQSTFVTEPAALRMF
jgi:hypothetical protein